MNTLITGLAFFALGLGEVVLILIWHKYRVQRIRQTFADRAMWKARNKSL
jgi:hypothetical protein